MHLHAARLAAAHVARLLERGPTSLVPKLYRTRIAPFPLRPIAAVVFRILTGVGGGTVRDVVVSRIPTPARQALRRRYTVAQFSPDAMQWVNSFQSKGSPRNGPQGP